jgi:hypothetical protein
MYANHQPQIAEFARQSSEHFRRIAFRTHVASSRRAVIAECWRILGRRNRGHDKRDARHALYLGALKGHEGNRAFVRKWRL